MKYEKYSFLNKPISRFIFGCDLKEMHLGEDVSSLLDSMYELGINTFDTARGYGESEKVLSKWLKTKDREKIIVISKCCLPSSNEDRLSIKNIISDVNTSLETLNTYIDILYLHRDNQKVSVKEIIDTLNKLINEGKVKSIGVSNWKVDRIKVANDYARANNLVGFSVSSPAYSLANMEYDYWKGGDGCVSIQGENNLKERLFYKENNMPVFPYSSLGRGFFAGRYSHDDPKFKQSLKVETLSQYYYPVNIERLKKAEELAKKHNCSVANINFAFLLNQDFKCHPVVATSNPSRMKENIDSLNIKLTKEELDYLIK